MDKTRRKVEEGATMDRDEIPNPSKVLDPAETDTQAAAPNGQRAQDALERHYARRIAEIRAGVPLSESGYVPLDRLRELANEGAGEGGSLGP